ncbi:hypothetical protein [Vallicoccus soli]|uniref:Uncharacterized protein n=1 Tax=Vallicoccus soli TaxID=2339232 RepID=A0A3A3YZT0_9ACTN|nr:hypothetical protein [Vallicoccus soli]RJK97479.1 hypothetical protein D5H78_00005 [Vallicoccus soli]
MAGRRGTSALRPPCARWRGRELALRHPVVAALVGASGLGYGLARTGDCTVQWRGTAACALHLPWEGTVAGGVAYGLLAAPLLLVALRIGRRAGAGPGTGTGRGGSST